MATQGEQGYALPVSDETENDLCRRVNLEGWNVLQIVRSGRNNINFGVLVEKADPPVTVDLT